MIKKSLSMNFLVYIWSQVAPIKFNQNKFTHELFWTSDDGKVVEKFLQHIRSERGYTTLDITKLGINESSFDIALETLRLKRMVDCGLIDYQTFKGILQENDVKNALEEVGIEELENWGVRDVSKHVWM